MTLPALLSRAAVHQRLQAIFPEGTPNRNYLTRKQAGDTVFVALYIGAIEGSGVWLAPKHVYRMSNEQAGATIDAARAGYAASVMKPGGRAPGRQWYADTTREPIRDETLREGLVAVGAAIERGDLATTSSRARYALGAQFAALFEPTLTEKLLSNTVAAWQEKFLSRGALARIRLVRRGAAIDADHVVVKFPNGETRRLKPGPSATITRAVVERFAPRFLGRPAVLFVSESGNKVVARDDGLARDIGLQIQADKNLPDVILVNLAPEHPLLVFVEVVATDGPINERRKEALLNAARSTGFPSERTAFVTAYLDRGGGPFKKNVGALAWGSYAWFASQPDGLIELSTDRRRLR